MWFKFTFNWINQMWLKQNVKTMDQTIMIKFGSIVNDQFWKMIWIKYHQSIIDGTNIG